MKNKAILTLAFAFFYMGALSAQSFVNLAYSNRVPLPKLAYVAMSAALPGAGEMALGKSTRGATFMASELLAAGMYLKTASDMKNEKKAYKNYAQHYAGVHPDMPQSHYQAIQNYISSDAFNANQEMLARNYFVIYHNDPEAFEEYMSRNTYTGDESWNWQSDQHWEKYKKLRRKHQSSKIGHTMAFGVMLLNRAVSVLDTAIIKGPGSLHAMPLGADGVLLGYQLEF